MSTQSLLPRIQKKTGRFVLVLLVGAWLVLQYSLPSVAFARGRGQTAAFASDPTYVLDKAGVSIVRLEVDYGNVNGKAQAIICTGLGVLVASKAVSPGGSYQNLVLTDADLINLNKPVCGSLETGFVLKDIQVFASNTYTQATGALALNCTAVGNPNSCNDQMLTTPTPVSPLALFSFQTPGEQPYLSLRTDTAVGTISNIGLTNPHHLSPQAPRFSDTISAVNSLQDYLSPGKVSPGTNSNGGNSPSTATPTAVPSSGFEPGTPGIDAGGSLVRMYPNTGPGIDLPTSLINEGLKNAGVLDAAQPNSLKALWDKGIDAYNTGTASSCQQAHTAFQQILTAKPPLNPSFKAASVFNDRALACSQNPNAGRGGSTTTSSGNGISLLLLIALGAGLLALALLLIFVTMLVGRSRRRRRELERFAAEQVEAQRIAEAEVQRQRMQPAPPVEVACPNCHQPVRLNDTMCPHCRFPLAPTASGLNVRLSGIAPMPPAQVAVNHVPPAGLSISEQPTIQFPPNIAANGEVPGGEKISRRKKPARPEQPVYDVQQARGHNLSLAVGTRSDPGLKRKHKPNEDSLFAMQGARTHNSQPQQFGLFVVADGMGGHANGQDASRLAIQTMIDFMLPRVSGSEPLDDDAFQKLLGDGVQNANQAVHNRNLEARADMGTTMTTALVIGATAHVANVGDSRTYLYREGQGLSKVTNDHSVVASLVEAGIIQPDDIYTHPKRNQIYRSLGEKSVVEVDTFKIDLRPGDKLLLCSDGLWDMVRDPLIQQVLSKGAADPNKTGQDLIKAALDGGGEDNVTVIVVQFAEMDEHTGMTGVQLLAKPETVTVPNLPSLS